MRVRIALRNLYISQTIILLFLVYAWWMWFPHNFTQLGGFYKEASLLIIVDIVLGPLLVFLVFKEGKKYLQFDINVLLSIQIAAFVYGAMSIWYKHPAYVVYEEDNFTIVNVSAVYPKQPLKEQLKTMFFTKPKMVLTDMPTDGNAQAQIIIDLLLGNGPDIVNRKELYQDIKQHRQSLIDNALSETELFSSEANKRKLAKFVDKQGGKSEDFLYYPLVGNNKKDLVWVINIDTIEPVGILDISPWPKVAAK